MSEKKKQGFFSKLFGSSSKTEANSENNSEKKKPQKSASTSDDGAPRPAPPKKSVSSSGAEKTQRQTSAASGGGAGKKPPGKGTRKQRKLSRKKAKKTNDIDMINTNQPLEYPTTPEMILAHHKKKPFLTRNEEWLVVELNEFECLVDSLEIIKMIANHSKFFEVEPDELWEEFFEYVEEMPSYDEVINFDVWQEFRDEKYPC